MSEKANAVFIWKKSVYENGFKCPVCGAALFDMATNRPTANLAFESAIPGFAALAGCRCGRCGNPVAVTEPNTDGYAPGLGGRYPGSLPREKVMVKMYGVSVGVGELGEWIAEREDELKRIFEKTKAKAVSPDPQGRFQAFLFLHPKARDKAYNILKRHFKTAAVILNPAMVDLTAGGW